MVLRTGPRPGSLRTAHGLSAQKGSCLCREAALHLFAGNLFQETNSTRDSRTRTEHNPDARHLSGVRCPRSRSEEHTSELQSREKLVCRLLLETKKYPLLKSHL